LYKILQVDYKLYTLTVPVIGMSWCQHLNCLITK